MSPWSVKILHFIVTVKKILPVKIYTCVCLQTTHGNKQLLREQFLRDKEIMEYSQGGHSGLLFIPLCLWIYIQDYASQFFFFKLIHQEQQKTSSKLELCYPSQTGKIFKLVVTNLILYNEHIVHFSVEMEGESEPVLCSGH